mmetsp:Transcript_7876/g.22497  ORF Transcript_7876/g.22497 Transcript_7876/m.22497 type:complete len:312 (-) Transcript_7876:1188-2123(-)
MPCLPCTLRIIPFRPDCGLKLLRTCSNCSQGCQQGIQALIKEWPLGFHVQVAEHTVCTPKARKHNSVDPLARERRVTGAVQAVHLRGVQWHGQHPQRRPLRDRPVCTIRAIEKSPLCPRRSYFLNYNTSAQPRPKGLQTFNKAARHLFLLCVILCWAIKLPVVNEVGSECVDNMGSVWRQIWIQHSGNGNKQCSMRILQLFPVLQDNVVALAVCRQHIRLDTKMHGEERRTLLEVLKKHLLLLRNLLRSEQLLEGIPPCSIADDGPSTDDLPVCKSHPNSSLFTALLLCYYFLDICAVDHPATKILNTFSQ